MFTNICIPVLIAATGAQVASAATVMAHFMVQESYAYNVAQWKTDIKAAQQVGIDGFALNWIPPDCESPSLRWQMNQIDQAYTAAAPLGFKIMLSFDMSYSVCNYFWNTTFMETMISKYADNNATLLWNDEIIVSTYGGDEVSEYGNDFFRSSSPPWNAPTRLCLSQH